jgi:hypothetical protein
MKFTTHRIRTSMLEHAPFLLRACFAILFLTLCLSENSAAQTFIVNSTFDGVDINPGDGICADASGNCTVRAAIMEANTLAGVQTITLPAGIYTLTISGIGENAAATGDLDITGDMTINGAGAASTIIDGGALDRVFEINTGKIVQIDGVTVRNGNPGSGGVYGGGIYSKGTLTLTNSIVTGCKVAYGGGIYNHSTMYISNSSIIGNSGDGGHWTSSDGLGGGIFNEGTMTVDGSSISGNTSSGVYWFPKGGGGIFNEGTLTVNSSTVSGNMAGGGVVNLEGHLIIENSTVSWNPSTSMLGGGGILNFSWFNSATTTVSNSTIFENRDQAGNGDAIAAGHAYTTSPLGTITIKNSIFASPTQGLGNDVSASGALVSLGHNIVSDASAGLSGPGDMNSTDPLLGPLAYNAGPTQNHLPLLGSPAIDGVPLADLTDVSGNPITSDQRGVTRPLGPAGDIGSVEANAITCPNNIVVNNTPGQCSSVVNFIVTATGNPAPTIVCSPVSGTVFPVGTTTVNCTATNTYGSSACSFTVTVVDNEAPAVACKNAAVTIGGTGIATITAADVVQGSNDNCGIASTVLSKTDFHCTDIGANAVTVTVTDIHGNSAACQATVTVNSALLNCSILAVPNNSTYTGGVATNLFLGYGPQSLTLIATASGGSSFTYSWTGGALSSSTSSSPTFSPTVAGLYNFVLTITNNFGCTSTCAVAICVKDIRVPNQTNKVYLCHVPPGNSNNPQTLSVAVSAVPGHLSNHPGDALGTCNQGCTSPKANADGSDQDGLSRDVVEGFELMQNRPNPFSSTSVVSFRIPETGYTTLRVFDQYGREVSTLVKGQMPAGLNTVEFNGAGLSSGYYMYRLEANGNVLTRTMMLTK